MLKNFVFKVATICLVTYLLCGTGLPKRFLYKNPDDIRKKKNKHKISLKEIQIYIFPKKCIKTRESNRLK